jgi:hypothetical protein
MRSLGAGCAIKCDGSRATTGPKRAALVFAPALDVSRLSRR